MPDLFKNLTKPFIQSNNGELGYIVGSIEYYLDQLATDIKLMRAEYFISTATEQWLDEWGSWFGVPRFLYETDEQYRVRVLAALSSSKVTVNALKQIVRNFLQDATATVIIYEPLSNMRRFNMSSYSDQDHYQDSTYYRIGVIDIQSSAERTTRFTSLINESKPAGVKVYFTKLLDLNYNGSQLSIKGTNLYIDNVIEKNIMVETKTDASIFSSGYPFKSRSGNLLADTSMQIDTELASYPYDSNPLTYYGQRMSMFYREILSDSFMPIDYIKDVPINEIIYVSDISVPMVVETTAV